MKKQVKRFTLVEILMVTGMICLLAALILVAYNGVYRSWASKNTIATMKAAHLALDRWKKSAKAIQNLRKICCKSVPLMPKKTPVRPKSLMISVKKIIYTTFFPPTARPRLRWLPWVKMVSSAMILLMI